MLKKIARREFLQLAKPYRPDKDNLAGWLISEKLDGTRCFWDGGLTRGLLTDSVPWASVTDPKTKQKKAKIKPIATGLWSRYGNPIMAPDEWLNQLPCCPLDGELWAGRGNFQLCRSICAGDSPDPRFKTIAYAVYSSPPLAAVFGTGEIKNTNMVCTLDAAQIEQWVLRRLDILGWTDYKFVGPEGVFADEVSFLDTNLDNSDPDSRCYLHPQTRLSDDSATAATQVEDYLQKVLDKGGEGVVIRNPAAAWTPKRHGNILKYKPFFDAEGTVVGFTSGRKTDKGSKHLGRIGALILEFQGKRLELAGLTDAERGFATEQMETYACANPGRDMPGGFAGKHFHLGQLVTFKYRELSDDGIPKDARYWRRRDVE